MPILIWREDISLTDQEIYTTNIREVQKNGYAQNLAIPFSHQMVAPILSVSRPNEQVDYTDAGVFLVSERLKELLKSFRVSAEFIECEVVTEDGRPTSAKYFHCNVLGVVECFDYKNSRYVQEDYIRGLEHLVLIDSAAAGHHLFLVGPVLKRGVDDPKAIGHVIYACSEELATEILKQGYTNIAFCLPKFINQYPIRAVAWKPS